MTIEDIKTTEREADDVALDAAQTAYDDVALDAAQTAYLAPMGGPELRSQIHRDAFTKRPVWFSAKLAGAVLPVAGATAVSVTRRSWPARMAAIGVNGVFFAHLLELQHECLHEHAYKNRRANRLAGVVCGAPTLSCYSHYKYEHLRHHAFLGTPKNKEFFQYSQEGLDSVRGLFRSAFSPKRYGAVASDMARAWRGRGPRGVVKKNSATRSRHEYIGLSVVLGLSVVALLDRRRRADVLCNWWLPAALVAEPIHFLIELPEHFGLNAYSNPDVLENSRTVSASRFARWYTNGNDLHTAHHVHQGVPMENIQSVQDLIAGSVQHTAPSYPAFYADVISGRIRVAEEPSGQGSQGAVVQRHRSRS